MMELATTHKIGSTVAAATMGWSVLYAVYIVFVSLLVLGPRDFNGDPNSLTTNVVGGTLLIASVIQAVLAITAMKRRTERLLILMLLLAGTTIAVASVGLGKAFIVTFTPLHLNLAVLLLLFGIHKFLVRSPRGGTDKSNQDRAPTR